MSVFISSSITPCTTALILIAEELLSFSTLLRFSQILVKNNYILDIGMGLMTFQRGGAVCFGVRPYFWTSHRSLIFVSQVETSCYR